MKLLPPGNDPFIPLTIEQIDNYYDILVDQFHLVKGELVRWHYKDDGIFKAIISNLENKKEISDAELICVDLIELQGAQEQWNNTLRIEMGQRQKHDELEKKIIELWNKLFVPDNPIISENVKLEPIIKNEHSGLIYEKYKDNFKGETKELWNKRFIFPDSNPVDPILVEYEAREGTNKLILIAILAAINETTSDNFPFDKFVKERFGIKAFRKAKSDHKGKAEYNKVIAECRLIFRK
jgi:hypothetical protein